MRLRKSVFRFMTAQTCLSGEVLSAEERELVREIVRAVRSIRFGSIALTIHEGNLVEIQKTEKIRRKNPA